MGICRREGEMRHVMVEAFFAFFSQIGAMVVLTSSEKIGLESCACAQIEALEEWNCWFYPDDAGDSSEREKCSKPDQWLWQPFLPFLGESVRMSVRPSIRPAIPPWGLPEAGWGCQGASSGQSGATSGLSGAWSGFTKRAKMAATITDQVCRISPSLTNPQHHLGKTNNSTLQELQF